MEQLLTLLLLGRVWGRHAPTRSLGKLARVWEVKSRWNTRFSRIENLWPRDGSCPLPLRSKRIFNKCFRIVKTQKISSGALLIWWGHHSHRTQFLPLFCSGVDEKSVSRPVGSWNFQGAFPIKEKYRPRSAAMILSGEVSGKMNRVCCGAAKIFMGNKSSPFCIFLQNWWNLR